MIAETKEEKGVTHHIRNFDSWLEFVSMAEKINDGCKGITYGGLGCESMTPGGKYWHGTDSLSAAIELAKFGWPEGRNKISQIFREINIEKFAPDSERLVRQIDVAGDEPDIDLFLRGDPENMATMHEEIVPQHGKVVRILINMSVNWFIKASSIEYRGAGILAQIRSLMLRGYSVQVGLVFGSINHDEDEIYQVVVPVMNAGDPLNLDTMAFMLLHPAVARRLEFAVNDCESKSLRKKFRFHTGGEYAVPCEPVFLPDHELYFRGSDGLLESEDQVLPFAKLAMEKLGITDCAYQITSPVLREGSDEEEKEILQELFFPTYITEEKKRLSFFQRVFRRISLMLEGIDRRIAQKKGKPDLSAMSRMERIVYVANQK